MDQPAQTSGPVAPDTSSPQYFSQTFGVDAAQAAELSRQARVIDGTRGGGAMTEAPVAAAAPAAPSAAGLSARAEYDQLLADRAAGKINNAQWHNGGAARERALADLIANGGGAQPAPAAQAPPSDPFAQHFAPPASADEYHLPHYEGEPTDEDIAADRTLKEAIFAAQLPKSVVESVLSNIYAAAHWLEAAPEDQRERLVQERLDANKVRMTKMWAKEGISWDSAVATIDREVDRWPPLLQEEFRKAGALLGPLDWDQILQVALHRNRTRAARR